MLVFQGSIFQKENKLSRLPLPRGVDTFDEFTVRVPGGAYTTFRTFEHDKALRVEDHLERLQETAQLAGNPLRFESAKIRADLRQIIDKYPQNKELRVQIVLDLYEYPGDIYYMSELLKTPGADAYQNGVKLITCSMRRYNPKAKLTRAIPRAEKIRSEFAVDVHEALMVDEDGKILEGLTSNFFAVKGGRLWTNESEVLSGVTRSLVIDAAEEAGLKLNLKSVTLSEILKIEEAFITSSSRAILPVVQIDDQVIGEGKPGLITHRLMGCLEDRIHREIEPI